MAPPTLLSMAQRACIRNLANLKDVGPDIPYELIQPVLRKIENPRQLYAIEVNSPQIADNDAELWRIFIARDIPKYHDQRAIDVEPKNPRSWYKVYRKLIKEEERAKEEQEDKLRAVMLGLDKQRETNKAEYLGKVISQPARHRDAFGGGSQSRSSGWEGDRTPSLRNAKKGKDIIAAIRRQGVSANATKSNGQKSAFGNRPRPSAALLPSGKSQITRAPASMLRDHAKPAPVATLVRQAPPTVGSRSATAIFAPKAGQSATEKAINDARRALNEERENKLRALTGRRANAESAVRSNIAAKTPCANPSSPKTGDIAPGVAVVPRLGIVPGQSKSNPTPAPPMVRKRPNPSVTVFMPAKKKRI